ncbi:MAG: Ldh family oxidoreductase [bacterium]|nr:Ldh family oxidoreductase [Myxococcales bacterium]
MSTPQSLPPAELSAGIRRVLRARDVSPGDADDVARALVETSLRGVDTHGVRLLPTYLHELDGGRAKARPVMTAHRLRPGLELVDAGGALGIVAGLAAARRAVDLARTQGVAWVGVYNSNHFGAAATYTLEIARAGMIGVAMSNADALMAPRPGRAPALGTNPLSIAAPTDGHPFCLDMATSQIAWSRIMAEWRTHGALPPGWALDADGRDCAEPGAGAPVTALPLGGVAGGYKGAGLALAIEVLCAGLVGARFGPEQSHLYGDPWDAPREVCHAFLAIDLDADGRGAALRARLGALLEDYRARPTDGAEPLVAPGDLEARSMIRRAAAIPIEAAVRSALDAVARSPGGSEG